MQFCSVLNFLFYSATLLFLKKPLSTIFFTNIVGNHLIFFRNCCPSEIIDFLYFLKLSQRHRLKCRNCLMFVTTNIRVLNVHWNECVRKKGNSQMCSNCNSTWFMQVFFKLTFLSFNFFVCSLHHFIIPLFHFFMLPL